MNQVYHQADPVHISKLVADLSDSKFLAIVNQDPVGFLKKYGMELPANKNYEIYVNTDDVMYFILPVDSDKELAHEVIEQLSAGAVKVQTQSISTLGCLSSLSSIGTIGCPTSSASSLVGSLGSLATGSCVNVKL